MFIPSPLELFLSILIMRQAYDSHCNLVLGEVEETIYAVDDDDEDEEVKVSYYYVSMMILVLRPSAHSKPDHQQKIRDAVCSRCVILA